MKRWLPLSIVVALLVGALALGQHRKPVAEVGPDAILHFIGDTERELSRLPLSATRVSDADEIRIGNELVKRYHSYDSAYDQSKDSDEIADFRRYITEVGNRVAAHATRKIPYTFHYVHDRNMINAFAIPGGHVYIGRGLIDLMDSEDELASILGHEIEHIDRYHAIERLQAQSRLQHLGIFRLLLEIPLDVFQAGYSKEQELEADREGTRLAVLSDYSPTATIRMFEAFDRRFHRAEEEQAKSPQEEAARVVLATMSGYFRSHPSTQERITQIRNLIAQEGWQARPERPFALAFHLWTDRAQTALQQHHYKEAAGLAARALHELPNHEPALRIQAEAQFYQADFRQAADTYRQLLKLNTSNTGYIQWYAFMLASDNRHSASQAFNEWMTTSSAASADALDSLAGLQLLNGNSTAADKTYADLKSNPGDSRAPDRFAWLGWWYYVSGDSARAFEMLDSARQQRPGNIVFNINFAWTCIEQHRIEQALSTLEHLHGNDEATAAEISMAIAVAHWLAEERVQALGNYQSAVDRQPAWKDSAWYTPQYSPAVSRAISEIKIDVDARKKKQLASN